MEILTAEGQKDGWVVVRRRSQMVRVSKEKNIIEIGISIICNQERQCRGSHDEKNIITVKVMNDQSE